MSIEDLLKKIEDTISEIRAVVTKESKSDIIVDESPVFAPGNPSSHDGKKPDLVIDKKEWFLKEGEGMQHLNWRAKDGSKDQEPEFNS